MDKTTQELGNEPNLPQECSKYQYIIVEVTPSKCV